MSTRIVGAALLAVAAAGASVGVGAGIAGGGEIVYGGTMVADPTTVEPGKIITVTNADGSECPLDEVTGQFTARPGQWVAQLDTDTGDWSVELEVPPNGPPGPTGDPTPFPPGEYEIFAWCERNEAAAAAQGAAPAQVDDFQYEPITVEVVAAQEGPPTSSGGTPTSAPQTPSDTTPTTTAGGAVRDAGAAAPVRAQPTFTG